MNNGSSRNETRRSTFCCFFRYASINSSSDNAASSNSLLATIKQLFRSIFCCRRGSLIKRTYLANNLIGDFTRGLMSRRPTAFLIGRDGHYFFVEEGGIRQGRFKLIERGLRIRSTKKDCLLKK